MNKPEQQFWILIRLNKPKSIWAQRVENGIVSGMPDVYLVGHAGRAVWLELKIGVNPKRDTSKMFKADDIRQEQINWHLKAHSRGLRTFIAVRNNRKNYLIHGSAASQLRDMTVADFKEYYCETWFDFWETLI